MASIDEAPPLRATNGDWTGGVQPAQHHPQDRARSLDGVPTGTLPWADEPPLAPHLAWALLALLDGGSPAGLDPDARSHLHARIRALVGATAEHWAAALEDRSLVVRCWAGPQALQQLDRAPGELLYVARMAPGHAGSVEAYVDLDAWMRVQSRVLMGTEVRGQTNLVVRVPQVSWPFRDGVIGRCVLAADALEHPDSGVVRHGLATLDGAAAEYLVGQQDACPTFLWSVGPVDSGSRPPLVAPA